MDNFNLSEYFKKQYLNEDNSDMYYKFLDNLRDKGTTNMFGASPYLQQAFDLEKKEARKILAKWMKSKS
jgi:hypothetical protein|tara:strand:+ start:1003 stop:1209 length:207 start_codon:yes stop_codon:yes gene_type:complete